MPTSTPHETPPRHAALARTILFWGYLAQLPLGLSVAFAYDTPLWAWHRQGMAAALWGTTDVPAAAMPIVDQLVAMLGATIASWGVAMAWVVAGPLRRGEPWAWWCATSSLATWFVFDTGLSLAHGVGVNVLFNTMALVLFGAPLAVIRLGGR